MSSLERRRRDRRRGGMHPGWAAFMQAHWAGFFLGLGFASVMVRVEHPPVNLWPCAIPFGIWALLFILGGRKAEKLEERP